MHVQILKNPDFVELQRKDLIYSKYKNLLVLQMRKYSMLYWKFGKVVMRLYISS